MEQVENITKAIESAEALSGMDEEFGETFGEMVERMGQAVGSDTVNKMVLDVFESFTSGYVSDPDGEWYDAQKDLLPVIDGMKITTHQVDSDEPGACLVGYFGNYMLEVSIEDKKKEEDIEYYSVIVVDKRPGIDGEPVFYSGVIFGDFQIHTLIDLIKDENVEGIIRLIHSKYHKWGKGWINTPECAMEDLVKTAKQGWYTAQINVTGCKCADNIHDI